MNNKPDRQSTRLRDYDYSSAGAYFITICAHNRECLFGDIVDGVMRLNEVGRVIRECWHEIPLHHPSVVLDQFVTMPNHVHGILFLHDRRSRAAHDRAACMPPLQADWKNDVGARYISPADVSPAHNSSPPTRPTTIGTIVGQFKAAVTRRAKRSCSTPLWQRNYYDHVIRNEKSLQEIRDYI